MNPQQTEKITQLIKTSSILSSAERGEWLLLLDLMNDKQVWELERILESVKPKTEALSFSKPAPALKEQAKTQPTQQTTQSNIASALHLGHILNLPKVQEGVQASQPVKLGPLNQLARGSGTLSFKEAVKSKSFLGKLKAILSEKELTPGRQDIIKELELPSVIKPSQAEPKKIVQPAQLIVKKSPPIVPRPKVKPEPSVSKFVFPTIRFEKPIVQSVKPVVAQTQIFIEPKTEVKAKQPQENRPIASSGQKGLEKWPKFVSKPVQNQVAPAQPEASRIPLGLSKTDVHFQKIKIDNLKDLTNLTIKDLRLGQSADLMKQFFKLVKDFGYYDTIFNLEKSPLYKSYIKTGINVLEQKMDFDTANNMSEEYLTRNQFEQFTDLLRQIQTV